MTTNVWSSFGRRWAALPYAIFDRNPLVQGGGIQFPATQVPSAGANTLDDYEEGTWTSGIAFGGASVGVTYSQQTGIYTKIGNAVHLQGRIVLTAKGSSVGNATITGVPFSPVGSICTGTVGFFSGFTGLVDGFFLQMNGAGTVINMRTGSATVVVALADTNFTNTTDFMFSITLLL